METTKNEKLVAISKNGLFKAQTANEWIEEASNCTIPKMLFGKLWFEGELCILYADTNLGKSILAVQIGNSISKGEPINGFEMESEGQKVLYFDFELSKKQFEARYSNEYSHHYIFNENFVRVEINPDCDVPSDIPFESYLNISLESVITEHCANVIIIDNITYLKDGTEAAKDALPLMKKLKELKAKYNLSILVLAHTPKRNLSKPLDRNDLQGSKMLINFCDSSFAIGESFKDKNIRYIKQIKQRNTPAIYVADNIALLEIVKPHNFLFFDFIGVGNENDHLKPQEKKDIEQLKVKAKQLHSEGNSYRDIAQILNISKSSVERYIKQ